MGACGRWLLDGYLPRHPRVDGTEVGISSCGREGIGEALTRLQDRRLFELIFSARHHVRHVIVIDPGHGCAGGYRECSR